MDTQVIELRIRELKENATAGQEQLRHLDAKKIELQTTLTRISGAIQVLEEIMAEQAGRA